MQQATQTILGVWSRLHALREKIVKELPGFDVARFDKLEDYTLGFRYVQSRYALATKDPNNMAMLLGERMSCATCSRQTRGRSRYVGCSTRSSSAH